MSVASIAGSSLERRERFFTVEVDVDGRVYELQKRFFEQSDIYVGGGVTFKERISGTSDHYYQKLLKDLRIERKREYKVLNLHSYKKGRTFLMLSLGGNKRRRIEDRYIVNGEEAKKGEWVRLKEGREGMNSMCWFCVVGRIDEPDRLVKEECVDHLPEYRELEPWPSDVEGFKRFIRITSFTNPFYEKMLI